MKGGQLKNMKIELNQEDLNLLITCVTESKNNILELLKLINEDELTYFGDVDELSYRLYSLSDLKTKLCNYSIELLEEN